METKSFIMTSSFYPPYHVGGACIHVYDLANALADLGHEVHIIYSMDCYYLKKGNMNPKGTYLNNEKVILHPIKSPASVIAPIVAHTFGDYFPLSNKILQTMEDIDADVIHHHNISGFGPFILKAKADKVVYTAHDYWLICPTYSRLKNNKNPCISPQNCSICSILCKKPPQIWRYINDKRVQINNIDTIIAPSKFFRNELIRLGIDNSKIEVIPNFVNVKKSEKDRYFKYPYLLFVGRLDFEKGITFLIESFLEISKIDQDLHLVIVGDGDLREKVNDQSKKSQGKINWLGYVESDTLSNLYQYAMAVVIPSIFDENCPLVALEAITLGTPIIGSNHSGFPEIIDATKGGILIDCNNAEILKKNLLEILNKDLLNDIKKDIKLADNYSKQTYIEKYLSLIEKD